MKKLILSVFFLFSIVTNIYATDYFYVCKDGVYERIAIENGVEIDKSKYDCDSIIFEKPQMSVQLDFTEFSKSHKVKSVFVKSTGGQKICSNEKMKPYTSLTASSQTSVCDVIKKDVTDETIVILPLDFIITLSSGLTFTLLCDDGQYYTMTDNTSIKASQAKFINKYTFEESSARKNNWMATIPSKVLFNMLTIPGTHDAATCGVTSDIAKTQDYTIAEQLQMGIRAFDLRPRYKASSADDLSLDKLEIYHGIVATGVLWKDAIKDIVSFLDNNPTETVFINMQKEASSGTDYSSAWRTSIRTSFQNNTSHLLSKITTSTTLNDCRGKIVVVSHNPYGTENVYYDIVYGGLTASWDDNASFSTTINYTNSSFICPAQVSDNYNATNSTDKQGFIKTNLDAANSDISNKWFYTFTNVAWTLFGHNPSHYADIHNPYLTTLMDSYNSRLGLIFCDFLGSADHSGDKLLNAIITQNHKYLY